MICIEKGNEKLILTKDSNLIENFCFIFHSILFIKRNLLFRKTIYEKIHMYEWTLLFEKKKNYVWCVSKIYMWYLCCFCICLFNCIINGIELNRLWNFFRVFDLTHHSQKKFFFTIWNIAKIFFRESNKYTNTNVTTKNGLFDNWFCKKDE